jgi:hypothetical protein
LGVIAVLLEGRVTFKELGNDDAFDDGTSKGFCISHDTPVGYVLNVVFSIRDITVLEVGDS